MKSLSHVRLIATPWTVAYQAPLSTGFPRQEYWSGLPFPSPGDLSCPGIEPESPALQADSLQTELSGNLIKLVFQKSDLILSLSESEVIQSCPTFCNPMDCSLPGSSVHGIFQARILERLPFPSPGDVPDPGLRPAVLNSMRLLHRVAREGLGS